MVCAQQRHASVSPGNRPDFLAKRIALIFGTFATLIFGLVGEMPD
jgi:hypothetical protein